MTKYIIWLMKVSILEFSCRFDYNHFGYYYLVQRKKNIDFPGSNHCFPCKKCHFLGFPSILAKSVVFQVFVATVTYMMGAH